MYEKVIEKFIWERDKRLIRDGGFIPFCNAFGDPDHKLAKHHTLIAQKLERTITEPGYNLMICMPPGHAKSRYASVLFPTYFLGRFPGKSVIMATHTQDFSDKWGRTCKRIISTDKYKYVFGVTLNKDSQAASRFDLSNGSEYFGAGILGNITGQRADLAIMDDLLKGIEDADSETIRDKIWNAYIYDLRTRVKPGASKILINTRWHEDDPSGRILFSKDRENWDIISLPALAEEDDPLGRAPGEPLWPEYISKEMLENERDSLDKQDMRMWNSLFQQRPTIEAGDYFKSDWIKTINKLPDGLQYYGGSDYAVSAGKGDYTVHAIIGYDNVNDDIYIVHIWREREESNVWVDEFLDLVDHYKPLMWAEESGQIIKSLDPYIKKALQDPKRRFVMRQQFTSTTDKTSRARSFQAYMAQGKVYILNRDWTEPLKKELLSFPSGKHDDQVDALSLIGRMLSDMYMRVEKSPKKEDYEYKSSTIVLPGLNVKMNRRKVGSRSKI